MTTEVQIIPTGELVEELRRRFPDGCIVAMFMPEHEQRDVGYDHRIHTTGDRAVELANYVLWDLQDAYKAEGDDDDEQSEIDGCGG